MARPRWECGMERKLIGLIVASALMLVGCGGKGGDGTLEVTENGTYDVSGYSQVVVHVGDDGQADGSGETSADLDQTLVLTRVQFRDFSMEVPAEMVEGYTEQELSESSVMTLVGKDEPNATTYSPTNLDFTTMETSGSITLDQVSDAPQEDVNGITMAIRHQHLADNRFVEAAFIYNDMVYTLHFSYPTDFDEKYNEYADQFYRSIQMN